MLHQDLLTTLLFQNKYELIEDPDDVDKIYETTYGIPDHRIIKLTINE